MLARRAGRISSISSRALSTAVHRGAQDFHELRERSLLRYTLKASTEGDALSVIEAMDAFWQEYYKGESTTEWKLRGTALDDAIKKAAPSAAMELGTYCGYSAVRIGRLLPPGGKLVSVEVDPLYAAIATKVVEHAGLGDSVKIEIGDLAEKFDRIATKYSLGPPGMSESAVSVVPQLTALARGLFLEAAGCVGLPVRASEPFRARSLDALLMDHGASNYLPDLTYLESKGMIKEDTAVLCDWSLYPGSGDDPQAPSNHEAFMKHMESSGRGASGKTAVHNKDVFSVNTWSGAV